MILENELKYRCTLALDFLRRTISNGVFNLGEHKYSVAHHLYATSLFYSTSDIFEQHSLKITADELFQFVLDKTYSRGKSAIIVYEDASLTIWNTMAAIISLKRDNISDAIKYSNAVLECILNNKITNDFIKQKEQSSKNGKVLILMLTMYKKTNDEQYLNASKKVAQILLEYPSIDPHNAWGLQILNEITPQEKYTKHIDSMIKELQTIDIQASTSLLLAILQQCLISNHRPNEDVMREQCKRQIDHSNEESSHIGAFIGASWRQETRIDYTVQSVFSFTQYLKFTSIKNII